METTLILLQQVLIMFLLAAIGFLAYRTGKISNEGSKSIGNLLIYISLPAVIIKGFLVERTTERALGLLISMGGCRSHSRRMCPDLLAMFQKRCYRIVWCGIFQSGVLRDTSDYRYSGRRSRILCCSFYRLPEPVAVVLWSIPAHR